MSAPNDFATLAGREFPSNAFCFGVVPLVTALISVAYHYDNLNTKARARDYTEARVVAHDLAIFNEKAKGGEEALVQAYNTRKEYLGPTANLTVVDCMRKALMPKHGDIELAQTSEPTKMTSYVAPMANNLLYSNSSTVAVVNFSKIALTDCALASHAAYSAVPTADQARTNFYFSTAMGTGLGGIWGLWMYGRRRQYEAEKMRSHGPD